MSMAQSNDQSTIAVLERRLLEQAQQLQEEQARVAELEDRLLCVHSLGMRTSAASPTSPAPELLDDEDRTAGFFEGTEKRIEMDFGPAAEGCCTERQLLDVPAEGWDEVIRLAGTQNLHVARNGVLDGYLLSESSLLVGPRKLVLKTCGRTVPLKAVPHILQLAKAAGMSPEWLGYSRRNLLSPSEQPREHQCIPDEIAACNAACNNAGHAHILGPVDGDHWLVYNADFEQVDGQTRSDYTIDMMMYELPENVRRNFWTSEDEGSRRGAQQMTESSGLSSIAKMLSEEAIVDDYCFSPCGYSCNVLAGSSYAIVHVTPEENCSYASFETNLDASFEVGEVPQDVGHKLQLLVTQVLERFQPGKFTLTLSADAGVEHKLAGAPFSAVKGYSRTGFTSSRFELDYVATVAHYSLDK